MGLNPETNKFEYLKEIDDPLELKEKIRKLGQDISNFHANLIKPNGDPVPKTWTTFKIGELVEIRGSTFKVAYIGETSILFEPASPIINNDS